jgi:hypothetical protein
MWNRKIGTKAAVVISTVFLAGGLFYLLQYYFALENEKKEWYKTEYVEKGFSGTIKDIEDYSYNNDFHNNFIGLTIATLDSVDNEIHYGMLNLKTEPMLKDFVERGDSVFKRPNEKEVTFKKADGQTKTFILPIEIEE